MRRRGLNLRKGLLRLILPMLRRLPPPAATALITGIGQTEYRVVRGLRIRFDRAVARGESYFQAHWDVARVGRELAGNQIRWRTRDQLLDGLPDKTVASLISVRGADVLERAISELRGVILLGNHFGAHLVPAHWVIRQGYALRLFMERPHHVSRLLSQQFDSEGPLGQKKLFISRKSDAGESAAAVLRATRVLKAGMVVFIASDVRWSGANVAPARFLGQRYDFSATWVKLAALSGAPVVPVFCSMTADGMHELEFLEPWYVPSTSSEADIARWVQRSLDEIEARVRRDPANSNEYFFWSESDDWIAARRRAATSREATVRRDGGSR
jgi:KDO2-lipid IV(A) lauroyltransferase